MFSIPDETLKRRFRMLEKKGQQILVVKKLLKKRHEKSESKSASLRSESLRKLFQVLKNTRSQEELPFISKISWITSCEKSGALTRS